jgi:VWFA-related protein
MLLSAASAFVGERLLRAQTPPQAANPTFSADVKVVNVFVTVRDKNGSIVKNLAKEDFTLNEDGRAQIIRYFSRESDLPLTIGLIVDTTPSESNMLDEERRASRTFLSKMLRPDKDKAFLIQYSNEVELLQDVTSSPGKLDAALNLLERHEFGGRGAGRGSGGGRGRGGGGAGGPGGSGGRNPYATVLSDAVYLASDEIMRKQKGRKALFILGDGDHIGSREEMAINAALRADTIIYAIRIYDKDFGGHGGGMRGMGRIPGVGGPGMGGPRRGGGPGGGGPGRGGPGGRDRSHEKEDLQTLSRRTGGAYFEVGKKETLEKIYGKIEEELRSQYSLGYTPEANAQAGYRRIQVAVQKKDLVVQGREGYYPEGKP